MRDRLWLPAVIALGANLGDRETTLRAAVAEIGAIDGVRSVHASGIVESHAVKLDGVDELAPDYLNAVVTVSCGLSPEQLLDELNRIEAEHGRVRVERWGDRTLDLDIVTFALFTQHDERLTLPHPRAWERPFVIVPWLQVQPDAVLPGRGPIADLAAAHSDQVWGYAASPLVTA
ncbi:MAG: 2-amino-4-hydroxy-6-hydroxymethyldihydropteridine diphosphokinase [Actinomycetota bacterium]